MNWLSSSPEKINELIIKNETFIRRINKGNENLPENFKNYDYTFVKLVCQPGSPKRITIEDDRNNNKNPDDDEIYFKNVTLIRDDESNTTGRRFKDFQKLCNNGHQFVLPGGDKSRRRRRRRNNKRKSNKRRRSSRHSKSYFM
jgi:hypothetical protein